MIYVGIDVASKKHDFTIMNSAGATYTPKSITIPNTDFGYEKLHKSIQEFCGANKDYQVRIGLESTGFYHLNILSFLTRAGYEVMVINPILINMSKKSKKLHTAKNDNLDSRAICKFLRDPDTSFTPYTSKSYHNEALKSLSRERFWLVDKLRKEKLKVYKLIVEVFPEYLSLFSNVYQGSAADILMKYPSPTKMANARISTLQSMIHGRCKVTALQIHDVATHSVGKSDEFLSFQLLQAFKRLKNTESEINLYELKIEQIVRSNCPVILSIPGISIISAGLILGEIGDIHKFKNVNNLISFAGIDIEPYDSGNVSYKNRINSKKGSSYLRYALFQVARVIWRFDEQFHQYYLKKKSEHKHFFVILGHIQKKILRVLFAVLKNNKVYFLPQF